LSPPSESSSTGSFFSAFRFAGFSCLFVPFGGLFDLRLFFFNREQHRLFPPVLGSPFFSGFHAMISGPSFRDQFSAF